MPQIALQLLVQEELSVPGDPEWIGRIELDAKRKQYRVDVLHLLDDVLGQVEPVALFAAVHVAQSEVVAIVDVQLLAHVLEQKVAAVVGLRIHNILMRISVGTSDSELFK